MNRAITLSRYCCPDCGGHRVETLDWITVNGADLVGGDPCGDYWCPDCETHPSTIERHDLVFQLCASCAGHKWGTRIPLPGVVVTAAGTIECCEECGIYANAFDAAQILARQVEARGGGARVSIAVTGIRADGWDECAAPNAPG
jgi:hypothetical protein